MCLHYSIVGVTALPLEDSGWLLYFAVAIVLSLSIAYTGYKAFEIWGSSVRLFLLRGEAKRWLKSEWVVILALLLRTSIFVIALWMFINLVVWQEVQRVRFDGNQLTLEYRWSKIDIAYRDVIRISLRDSPPVLMLPLGHANQIIPLCIVIDTNNTAYKIDSRSVEERGRIKAIYEYLKQRLMTNAHDASLKNDW